MEFRHTGEYHSAAEQVCTKCCEVTKEWIINSVKEQRRLSECMRSALALGR